ncbi:MAG: TFIIB-type zinc ribbon-containing protein [Candidatus Nomurabacteria bacterium]|nr:TFIIB-type zinc ribbon-containing protein [Candidatus Nomurabacteria bacterium]
MENNNQPTTEPVAATAPQVANTSSGKGNGLNRCPFCGATDVVLDPSTGKLRCQYCRAVFDPETVAEEDIHQLKGEIVGGGATAIIPDTKDIMTFKCEACGAEIVIDTAEATSARCHWCRHSLSINEQIPNGAVPDMVLPFKMNKMVAEGKIQAFVKKRQFFAHPTFRKEFTTENVIGVYLPYMVVDVNAHSKLTGQGEHLVRAYTKGVGNKKTTYYDADLYNVGREFDILIDGLTVESSADKLNQDTKANTNNIINAIMPFDTENCVKWNANYLKGYASEKRDTNTEQLKPTLTLQAKDVARFKANESLTFYDRGVNWQNENMNIAGLSWRAAYLPVWLYSYYQKDKKLLHYCAVNARTGETMGSVPVNKKRLISVALVVEIVGIVLGTSWIFAFLNMDLGDNDPTMLGLLGYTPGFIFYWVMLLKYRNTNARHFHEKETKATVENLVQTDDFVEHRLKLRNPTIDGANNTAVTGSRNNTGTGVGKTGELAMKFVKNAGFGKFIPK